MKKKKKKKKKKKRKKKRKKKKLINEKKLLGVTLQSLYIWWSISGHYPPHPHSLTVVIRAWPFALFSHPIGWLFIICFHLNKRGLLLHAFNGHCIGWTTATMKHRKFVLFFLLLACYITKNLTSPLSTLNDEELISEGKLFIVNWLWASTE